MCKETCEVTRPSFVVETETYLLSLVQGVMERRKIKGKLKWHSTAAYEPVQDVGVPQQIWDYCMDKVSGGPQKTAPRNYSALSVGKIIDLPDPCFLDPQRRYPCFTKDGMVSLVLLLQSHKALISHAEKAFKDKWKKKLLNPHLARLGQEPEASPDGKSRSSGGVGVRDYLSEDSQDEAERAALREEQDLEGELFGDSGDEAGDADSGPSKPATLQVFNNEEDLQYLQKTAWFAHHAMSNGLINAANISLGQLREEQKKKAEKFSLRSLTWYDGLKTEMPGNEGMAGADNDLGMAIRRTQMESDIFENRGFGGRRRRGARVSAGATSAVPGKDDSVEALGAAFGLQRKHAPFDGGSADVATGGAASSSTAASSSSVSSASSKEETLLPKLRGSSVVGDLQLAGSSAASSSGATSAENVLGQSWIQKPPKQVPTSSPPSALSSGRPTGGVRAKLAKLKKKHGFGVKTTTTRSSTAESVASEKLETVKSKLYQPQLSFDHAILDSALDKEMIEVVDDGSQFESLGTQNSFSGQLASTDSQGLQDMVSGMRKRQADANKRDMLEFDIRRLMKIEGGTDKFTKAMGSLSLRIRSLPTSESSSKLSALLKLHVDHKEKNPDPSDEVLEDPVNKAAKTERQLVKERKRVGALKRQNTDASDRFDSGGDSQGLLGGARAPSPSKRKFGELQSIREQEDAAIKEDIDAMFRADGFVEDEGAPTTAKKIATAKVHVADYLEKHRASLSRLEQEPPSKEKWVLSGGQPPAIKNNPPGPQHLSTSGILDPPGQSPEKANNDDSLFGSRRPRAVSSEGASSEPHQNAICASYVPSPTGDADDFPSKMGGNAIASGYVESPTGCADEAAAGADSFSDMDLVSGLPSAVDGFLPQNLETGEGSDEDHEKEVVAPSSAQNNQSHLQKQLAGVDDSGVPDLLHARPDLPNSRSVAGSRKSSDVVLNHDHVLVTPGENVIEDVLELPLLRGSCSDGRVGSASAGGGATSVKGLPRPPLADDIIADQDEDHTPVGAAKDAEGLSAGQIAFQRSAKNLTRENSHGGAPKILELCTGGKAAPPQKKGSVNPCAVRSSLRLLQPIPEDGNDADDESDDAPDDEGLSEDDELRLESKRETSIDEEQQRLQAAKERRRFERALARAKKLQKLRKFEDLEASEDDASDSEDDGQLDDDLDDEELAARRAAKKNKPRGKKKKRAKRKKNDSDAELENEEDCDLDSLIASEGGSESDEDPGAMMRCMFEFRRAEDAAAQQALFDRFFKGRIKKKKEKIQKTAEEIQYEKDFKKFRAHQMKIHRLEAENRKQNEQIDSEDVSVDEDIKNAVKDATKKALDRDAKRLEAHAAAAREKRAQVESFFVHPTLVSGTEWCLHSTLRPDNYVWTVSIS